MRLVPVLLSFASAVAAAAPTLPVNVIANPGFENTTTPMWQSAGGSNPITVFSTGEITAHTGGRLAQLGVVDGTDNRLSQTITVPTDGNAALLTFWLRVTGPAPVGDTPSDLLTVSLYNPSTGKLVADLATFSDLDGGPWRRSPALDLTAWRGQTLELRFSSRTARGRKTTFSVDDVSLVAADLGAAQAENGWWWNVAESGRGFALERQGDLVFLAGFMYAADGGPTWYTAALQRGADGRYRGSLTRHDGATLPGARGAWHPPTVAVPAASAVLTVDSNTTATLALQGDGDEAPRRIALERYPVSDTPFAASRAGFESGWWWNPAQDGRGYFVEVQGVHAYVAPFTYDAKGHATWGTARTVVQGQTTLSAPLLRYAGGQTLFGNYRAPAGAGSSGILGADFSSATEGRLYLPGEPDAVPIKRFVFKAGADAAAPYAGRWELQVGGQASDTVLRTTSVGNVQCEGSTLQCSGSVAADGSFSATGMVGALGASSATVVVFKGRIDGARLTGMLGLFSNAGPATLEVTGRRTN